MTVAQKRARNAAHQRASRAKKLADGLCRFCSSPYDVRSGQCDACRQRTSELRLQDYYYRRDAGLCTEFNCHRKAADGVLCRPHRERLQKRRAK